MSSQISRGQIVTEQVGKIVFGDAIIIARANQDRTLVRHGHFGAQCVELRHGSSLVTVLLIFQFLLQQIHRGFVNDDLLRGQQHVIIGDARIEQRVGDDGLVLRQRLLFGRARRADGGAEPAAFINGLHNLDTRIPILMRR